MMKKFNLYAFSLLAGALLACSEDADMVATTELNNAQLLTKSVVEEMPYSVIDGCLHVDNMEAYRTLSNSLMGKTEEELLAWSQEKGIESLLSKRLHTSSEEKSIDGANNETSGAWELAMHNANGIMFINDTIYKIVNNKMNVYQAENVTSLEELSANAESFPHTQYNRIEDLRPGSLTKGVGSGDRSYVIEVSKKRREYVSFDVKGVTDKGYFVVNVKMTGKAQKKGPLGRWQLSFDDEMNWGQCFCDGVYINGNLKEGTQIASMKVTNKVSTQIVIPIGINTAALGQVFANCRFTFCKNTIKGDETYAHSYEVRHP